LSPGREESQLFARNSITVEIHFRSASRAFLGARADWSSSTGRLGQAFRFAACPTQLLDAGSELLSLNPVLEGSALKILHRAEVPAFVLIDLANGADVGVIQAGYLQRASE
jgi:hypothetical protein